MLIVVYIFLAFLSTTPVYAQYDGRTTNGELAFRALYMSFPDVIAEVAFTDGDWTITTRNGQTFFWAGGRILPVSAMNNADSYGFYSFYAVPAQAASPSAFPPRYIETLRTRGNSEARQERSEMNRTFQGILYGGLERQEIEARLERIDFLGRRVTVHQRIVDALRRIEAEIRAWDGGEAFIASLNSADGYSWRSIAGTQRMSYHSWGLAVDIQPRRLGTLAIYWLWERGRNDDWMLVPLERRWNPPNQVIAAFEKEGFIWGGKWPMYDNMHFEYRPELHAFTRLMADNPLAAGRDLHHVYPAGIMPPTHGRQSSNLRVD